MIIIYMNQKILKSIYCDSNPSLFRN